MAEKLQKHLHRAPVCWRALRIIYCFGFGFGTTDMGMDIENLKPLTVNLSVPLSPCGKHCTCCSLLYWLVRIKLAFFHSFLPPYISAVLLEPCLKSTVWYNTVSWEIRQINAMFRNYFSVKSDHNWLNCWIVKEFLLFLLDKQTFIASNSCLTKSVPGNPIMSVIISIWNSIKSFIQAHINLSRLTFVSRLPQFLYFKSAECQFLVGRRFSTDLAVLWS